MANSDEEDICNICEKGLAKYICPKCNVFYCSVTCYQSAKHLECSEKFYENCVKEEIKSKTNNKQLVENISDIIKRVNDEFQNNIDSDDDDEEIDLADRLKDADLNDVKYLWNALTRDEQQEFEALVNSGDIVKFMPTFIPWWEQNHEKKIEEINEVKDNNYCPPIIQNIKPFELITKVKPSECVKFNLVNVLAAYTFVVRYFNGDHFDYSSEAVYVLTTLSKNLLTFENFETFDIAIESVHQQSIQNDWVFASSNTAELLHRDVKNILRIKNKKFYYALCALSDVYVLLKSCQKEKPKQDKFSPRFTECEIPPDKIVSKEKLKSCILKIRYYLSYVNTFDSDVVVSQTVSDNITIN